MVVDVVVVDGAKGGTHGGKEGGVDVVVEVAKGHLLRSHRQHVTVIHLWCGVAWCGGMCCVVVW